MPPSDLLRPFFDRTAARPTRLLAAQGFIPFPISDMLRLLVHLTNDPDDEISQTAAQTLASWPERELLAELKSTECDAEVLTYFVSRSSSEELKEAVIWNPSTPVGVIAQVAPVISPRLLEAIVHNRQRLLEHPEILEKVRQNPGMTSVADRLLKEVEEEFFRGKKSDYRIDDAEAEAQVQAEPDVAETEAVPSDLVLEGLPSELGMEEGLLQERLAQMTVPQRIRRAQMGNREERSILIRETNKVVARAVLNNPRLTQSEIESFVAMRNVVEEVLRDIANNREWIRYPAVARGLVKNPKTPVPTAQRIMPRLLTQDLVLIGKDRGVPDVIRRSALRLVAQRSAGPRRIH